MMIDGVENARVHIAMPERVLFRGNTSSPTAAVTIVTRSGQFDEKTRISGIQRLVAASVPDLDTDQVSVLNSAGEIISPVESPISSVLNEYKQIAEAYRKQTEIALALEMPELVYDLKILARPLRAPEDSIEGSEKVESDSEEAESEDASAETRNYTLRVLFTTDEKLSDQTESRVEDIITEAAQLDIKLGDFITFKQRELPLNLSLANAAKHNAALISKRNEGAYKKSFSELYLQDLTMMHGVIVGGVLILLGFTGVAMVRRRRQVLSAEEHIEFARRLKLQLKNAEEVNDAVL